MLELNELNEMIKELEEDTTTFSNCQKLASLYIIKSYNHENNSTMQELNDILPQYKNYCMIKKRYQLNELPENTVVYAMQDVSKEIKDFILSLYNNTITKDERYILKNMIDDLQNVLE